MKQGEILKRELSKKFFKAEYYVLAFEEKGVSKSALYSNFQREKLTNKVCAVATQILEVEYNYFEVEQDQISNQNTVKMLQRIKQLEKENEELKRQVIQLTDTNHTLSKKIT